ncbi:MAG: phosphoenolpyruvate carboxykinase (ATP) [Chitinophagales bacterium]
MKNAGIKNPDADLSKLGFKDTTLLWNLSPAALIEKTLTLGQGELTDSGALLIKTGEFTGRSPKDRYIVKDKTTEDTIDWGDVNIAIDTAYYDRLYKKVISHFNSLEEVYVRDAYACYNANYRTNIRVVTEYPWQNLFAYNMFLRPSKNEVKTIEPEWTVLAASGCMADPETDGTRQHNFAIINFTERKIIIGGTGYTGEIKKGIFSVLNCVLPIRRGVLPMHCSANVGRRGDTALFFGLSGTGKTTLSADPNRQLIGDDEHGWSESSVFNFEGGCYAKCINLSKETEPQIYGAIKFGALLENLNFIEGTRTIDFEDTSITENTRVSYPLYHIENTAYNLRVAIPQNVFFLTCDAFGVLPPISKLNPAQAMYHFLSGYTAKVAGTEEGVTEPMATFSACFGLPFLPLHPTRYAEMLGRKLADANTNVWLVNTGWTGGPYGVGHRMRLSDTRTMIGAALNGKLDHVKYENDPIFGLSVPTHCPDVPDYLLNPRNTWQDKSAYDKKANYLAQLFNQNFGKYADKASDKIKAVAPKMLAD